MIIAITLKPLGIARPEQKSTDCKVDFRRMPYNHLVDVDLIVSVPDFSYLLCKSIWPSVVS